MANTPNKLPLETQGGTWGEGLGGQQFKCIRKLSDWHQLTLVHVCRLKSGNGHRLNTSRPSIPQGAFRGGGGGLGCHKFKSLGKMSNGWTDWHQIWHTSADPSGNGYTPNKLPLETHLRGFRGQTFKSPRKLSNGWTDWHQLWFTSADSSGNGHRLNPSRPSIPQGALGGGGGGRGSQIQKSGEAVKRPNLVHVGGFVC